MIPEILDGCGLVVPAGDVRRPRPTRCVVCSPTGRWPRRSAGARASAARSTTASRAARRRLFPLVERLPPVAARAVRIAHHRAPASPFTAASSARPPASCGASSSTVTTFDLLTPGPAAVPGVTLHRLARCRRCPPRRACSGPGRDRAPLAVRRGRWDVVQSHERTLGQDVYRAGEGCHRAYLAGARDVRDGGASTTRVVLALERRVFARTPASWPSPRRGRAEIERLYGVARARALRSSTTASISRASIPTTAAATASPRAARPGCAAGAFVAALRGQRLRAQGAGHGHRGPGGAAATATHVSWSSARGRQRPTWPSPPGSRSATVSCGSGRDADAERWYAAADAVVLPTRYEPFGNVHLEALGLRRARGDERPGRRGRAYPGGLNGFAVDPLDARAVAHALERFGRAPRRDDGRGRSARRPSPYLCRARPTDSRGSTGG